MCSDQLSYTALLLRFSPPAKNAVSRRCGMPWRRIYAQTRGVEYGVRFPLAFAHIYGTSAFLADYTEWWSRFKCFSGVRLPLRVCRLVDATAPRRLALPFNLKPSRNLRLQQCPEVDTAFQLPPAWNHCLRQRPLP